MASEITEQYLKVIFNLTEDGGSAKTSDIAQVLGIAPSSVTEMLQKLSDKGYVNYEPYRGVTLRHKGRKLGCKMARKHRLLERFLQDYMGLEGPSSHKEACRMEHALSDEAEHGLCKMMHHPTECPHGKHIPRCERRITCDKCAENTVPLSDLSEGESATVSHLASRSRQELCRMLSMGFVPGSKVTVEKKLPMGGPIIVSITGTTVAIARDIGDILHVMKAG